MKSSTITTAIGGVMAFTCAGAGLAGTFLLSGMGICGFPLTWGIFF